MAGSTMKEKGSMMNRTVKSAVAVAAIAAMSLGTLAACGSSTSGDDSKGKVYYLNFKPEAADQWTALAKEYTKEKEHRDRLTQSTNKNIKIEQFNIEPGSQLIGQSIQQSGIREKNACLILGIERDGRLIMNLSSQTVFEENDSVWVAGEYRQIVQLSEDSSSN